MSEDKAFVRPFRRPSNYPETPQDINKQEKELIRYKLEDHPEDIEAIKKHTKKARTGYEGDIYETFADEMTGHVGVNRGDYESDLRRAVNPIYEGQISEMGMEVVNFSEEIGKYCQALLDKGEEQVVIVDFAAGRATTLCRASRKMEDLVKQGKVRLIATNGYSEPTEDDLLELKFRSDNHTFNDVIYALENKTVEYKKADILELHDLLKNQKVHLMFMSHIWEIFNVGEIADLVLKTASEMLHPDYGTIVVGHAHAPSPVSCERGFIPNLVDQGLDNLEFSGFKENKYRNRFQNRFLVYQAAQAPNFNLALPENVARRQNERNNWR